jgi:hypothetical protein
MAEDLRETDTPNRTAPASRLDFRRWDTTAPEKFVKPGSGLFGLRSQEGTEFDLATASARDVIDGPGRDRHPEHLFQAEGLGAELNLVVIPAFTTSSLVLDRIRDLAVVGAARAKLHEIGNPGDLEAVADESKAAGNANRRPRTLGDSVGPAMVERPTCGVDVLDPDAFGPKQCATPLAEEEVVE